MNVGVGIILPEKQCKYGEKMVALVETYIDEEDFRYALKIAKEENLDVKEVLRIAIKHGLNMI